MSKPGDRETARKVFSRLLNELEQRWLLSREFAGGVRSDFLEFLSHEFITHHDKYSGLQLAAFLEAGAHQWNKKPRIGGLDLFAVSGLAVPETLTRPTKSTEGTYEKVHQKYATVEDLFHDYQVTRLKADQTVDAADRKLTLAETALAKAGGDLSARLADIADDE